MIIHPTFLKIASIIEKISYDSRNSFVLYRKQGSHLKELNCINTRLIQIDHNDIESDSSKRYDELGLLRTDKKVLVSYTGRNTWLNAHLIIAGQRLLELYFPNVGGLQDVTKQGSRHFISFEKETGEFIQILHCNRNHWICISNVGCKPGIVKVFDSMHTGTACNDLRETIASILHTSRHSIQLVFPSVTQQKFYESCDCGLFSLDTTCSGEEPSSLTYNQAKLRKHLKFALILEKLNHFHYHFVKDPWLHP